VNIVRKVFSNEEVEELLDNVVAIAILTYESGIRVALNLRLSEDIIMKLRQRTNRATMISECTCPDCTGNKL